MPRHASSWRECNTHACSHSLFTCHLHITVSLRPPDTMHRSAHCRPKIAAVHNYDVASRKTIRHDIHVCIYKYDIIGHRLIVNMKARTAIIHCQRHLSRASLAPGGGSSPLGAEQECKGILPLGVGSNAECCQSVNAEPSNISHADAYIPYALHTRRICSAKLYLLRTGRHGGQREQRSLAHHPRAQKTTTLGARERHIR